MKKRPIMRVGDLQLRILRLLWAEADLTVRDVHGRLGGESKWAYTTIATMLKKMEARKLVSHRLVDRKFVYKAVATEEEVTRNMTSHLIERVFEGSLADMVNHLLQTREVSREELEELEELIRKRKGR